MDRLNKIIITMIGIIAVLIAIISAMIIYKPPKQEEASEKVETEIAEVILDDCTDEYEMMQEETLTTNANQEKISPNCKLILRKYYKTCKDEINEYIKIPENLINCTQQELQNQYMGWEVKEFSNDQIILYKEFEGECGEHYVLRDEEGKITIYKATDDGEGVLYEKTDISTDYLPKEDRESIKNGLKVNGKEKLNELIESFQ